MQEMNFTIVKKRATPLIQFIAALLVGWSGMAICKLLHLHNAEEYFAAFIAILFFCLINVVVSLAYDSYLRYTIPGYYLYVLLAAILLLSAKFISGISIWSLTEYRMMLVSISIFYLMASNLVRVMRLIYDAAEKEF